jgi:hypothetical protein
MLSPDGVLAVGYDRREIALAVAQDYGEGAHIIDTGATPYHPLAEKIENGEPVYLGFGGWSAKADALENLIEAIKQGYAPIVRAFAESVPDLDQHDRNGGTALLWAVAGREPDIVQMLLERGADPNRADTDGTAPLALAGQKDLDQISGLLRDAGAR